MRRIWRYSSTTKTIMKKTKKTKASIGKALARERDHNNSMSSWRSSKNQPRSSTPGKGRKIGTKTKRNATGISFMIWPNINDCYLYLYMIYMTVIILEFKKYSNWKMIKIGGSSNRIRQSMGSFFGPLCIRVVYRTALHKLFGTLAHR